jgi:membrane protease YdiL (CAAX protease family)
MTIRESLSDSVRAHALQFENPLDPAYPESVGKRALIAFVAVGIGLFYVVRGAAQLAQTRGIPFVSPAIVLTMLVAFVVGQRAFVRCAAASFGLRGLDAWTRRERLYLFQLIPALCLLFGYLFRRRFAALAEEQGMFMVIAVVTGIGWGIVQELLYRGWLQTELTRRFGAIFGLLVANLVFTFGPLHIHDLVAPDGVRWSLVAATFGIGLFFGVVYLRSGNLWIPAILHGLCLST